MVRAVRARRGTPRAAVVLALAVALATAGCGGGERSDRAGAAPAITVGAVIAPRGVTVSPSRIAAGTIELLVSNQTATSQRLELRSGRLASGGRLLAQRTGPVNPGATASLKAELDEGSYVVSVRDPRIDPATIVVAAASATTSDELLAP
jgi:hypothetical protein